MNIVLISPSRMDGSKGASLLMRNLFEGDERHRFLSLSTQKEPAAVTVPGLANHGMPGRMRRHPGELLGNLRGYLLGQSESLDGILHFKPTSALETALDSFAPDVIYSQLGPPWLMKLTAWVARRHRIPLIVHVMDDFLIDWPVSGVARRRYLPGLRWLNRQAGAAFNEVLKHSTVNYCISSVMAAEYTQRYGHPFSGLPHPVDGTLWDRQRALDIHSGSLSFGFVGSVQTQTNAEALHSFARLLDSSGNGSARLNIVSQSIPAATRESLTRHSAVSILEALPHAHVPDFLGQCDALLMPINFDPDSAAFCRLSWPTKLSEYLSSGTPVVYFGPQSVGFAQTLGKHTLAHLVTRSDAADVADCLGTYRHWAADVAQNAQAYAREQFDGPRLRLQMSETLARAGGDTASTAPTPALADQ